ncbi:MAG TPA: DUF3443 family protein [Candidatus Sulfotelmatobacter sp.]|nr:DUF3443 family protein [Candidatus Sulfotelmatobacter sp.]
MRNLPTLALLACLIFSVGCNWGKGTSTPYQPPISITLTPSRTVVTGGQKVTVTAAVYDPGNQGVTWTFSPLNFGSLSQSTATSVTYTAPATFTAPTTISITATSISNPNITSSLQISAAPISVSLSPPSAQTLTQGTEFAFSSAVINYETNAGVTWSLTPATGAGTLISPTPTLGVIYAAPAAVSQPTTVTLTATSLENAAAVASLQITVLPSNGGTNVAMVNVDGGPVPGQTYVNGAFTSVTLCNPGSITSCQTVDGVLVDTGSYGLRILQSEIPLLKITKLTDGNGNTLENCASSVDGSFLWGPVSPFDVYIAGEIASSSPVQVISSANAVVPSGCSNGGITSLNTPQLLGANGILGIGPEPTDCMLGGVNYCDGSVQPVPPNIYYACPPAGCATTDSPIIVPDSQQVTNPVSLFGDNNGVILQLPAVSGAQTAITGTMTFGIGTQSNNSLGSATVLTLDSSDHFTTLYNGQTLTSSFIDSGSNALYFPDVLPACADKAQYYCPASLTSLSATNQGATQGQTTVNFAVDNADNLFSSSSTNVAFGTLAGPRGTFNSCSQGNSSCTFDWGLPFFYGRSVYTAIDGKSVNAAPQTPWWAY